MGADFWEDWELGSWFDLLVPLGFALLLIVGNLLSPAIAIGYPNVIGTEVEKYLVVGIVAPVLEELGFRVFAMTIFSMIIPYGAGIIAATAVTFSSFHYLAYGLGLGAAFVGALIFGIVTASWIWSRRSLTALIGVIMMHSVFNTFLLAKALTIVPLAAGMI